MTAIQELVGGLYAALMRGDGAELRALLAPGFTAELPAGMPLGAGGSRAGAEEMIRDTWRRLSRAYAMRVEPEEWIPCADGRLLVLGRYRGEARSTGREVDAAFAHLWSAAGGRLTALWHVTDTAIWAAALEEAPA
jgi:2-(1,2-epoxy-1,2-dihydrophenyl)acetyl-CoA isomerase